MSKKKEAVVEEWRRLIVECENRPKGVKFGDWCKSVGVSKTNYYYWKKRLGEPQIIEHIMLLYNHRMCYTRSRNVLKS